MKLEDYLNIYKRLYKVFLQDAIKYNSSFLLGYCECLERVIEDLEKLK